MTVFWIIAAALVVVGAALYAHDRWSTRHAGAAPDSEPTPADATTTDDSDEACCGMHITCERDSLLASVSPEIEYFDDEELDRFAGRNAAEYTSEEIEEFREVLLTMRPDDIAPWARSIQLRGIELPDMVRDELLMIVAEARQQRTANELTA